MSASISNYFSELRTDVEGAYYGFYFLDFAGYYAREANDETELLKLLYQTLRALTNVHIPNRLIRCIYELKAVCINGEGPQVFECVSCGRWEENMKFSVCLLYTSATGCSNRAGADHKRSLQFFICRNCDRRTFLVRIFI